MEINNFSVRSERIRRWRETKKEYYKGPFIHRTEEADPCTSSKDKPLGWFGHYVLACPDDEDYPISFPGKEYYPVLFPGRKQRGKEIIRL